MRQLDGVFNYLRKERKLELALHESIGRKKILTQRRKEKSAKTQSAAALLRILFAPWGVLCALREKSFQKSFVTFHLCR